MEQLQPENSAAGGLSNLTDVLGAKEKKMSDKHIAVRLLEEKLYLHGNMVKLEKFLANPENTRDVDKRECELLADQLEAMKRYYGCLNLRSYYHANDRTWPDA